MIHRSRFLLIPATAILLAASVQPVQACAGGQEIRFDTPQYLDPVYAPSEYSMVWYGQKTKFRLLVSSYFKGGDVPDLSDECRGNADGAKLFNTAVAAEVKDDADRKLLIDLRHELEAICGPADGWLAYINKIKQIRASPKVQPYLDYLKAAALFYGYNHNEAYESFKKIAAEETGWKTKLFFWRKTPQSWVMETATYMTARLALIRAQVKWDGQSEPTPEMIDQGLLQQSEAGFQDYLSRYPEGLYAASAKGMKRRIVWLQGRDGELQSLIKAKANDTFRVVTPQNSERPPTSEIDEFIRFYNSPVYAGKDHPLVVTLNWFGDTVPTNQDVKALDQQDADFAAYRGLKDFMKAWAHFKAGRYQAVLDLPSPPPVVTDWNKAELSFALLRVRSLLELGKTGEAEQALLTIHAQYQYPHIEMLYARIAVAAKTPLKIFEPQAAIKSVELLSDMAQYGLSDDQLREGLQSKAVGTDNHLILLEELLRRQLLVQDFDALTKTIQGEENLGIFKDARTFIKNRTTPEGKLAIGKFIYHTYLTPDWQVRDHSGWEQRGLSELQQACPECITQDPDSLKVKAVPAYTYFLEAQAEAERLKQGETEASALHYIIVCFKNGNYSEYSGRCRWNNEKDINNGKLWFERLHKMYPKSVWAQKTPYYY